MTTYDEKLHGTLKDNKTESAREVCHVFALLTKKRWSAITLIDVQKTTAYDDKTTSKQTIYQENDER